MKQLRKIETVSDLNRVFVFDVETRGLSARPESFVFGCIYGMNGKFKKTFFNVYEMANYMVSRASRGRYYLAHNAEYDLSALFDNILLCLDNRSVFSGSLFIKAKKNGVTFLNSLAILKTSVAELGKIIGQNKLVLSEKFKREDNRKITVTAKDIEYCFRDCEIVYKFLIKVFGYAGIIKPTIASISMSIFTKRYLEKKIFIHPFNETFRRSYYGGRVECFKLGKVNAYKYDINSLYPYVCTEMRFPNFEKMFQVKNLPAKYFFKYLNSYEGCAHVQVTHEKSYVGTLPYRMTNTKMDEIIYPTGTFAGWYNFNELRAAIGTGLVKVNKVHELVYAKSISFDALAEYMEDFFELKNTSKGADKVIYKFLLNALTGKFAERDKNDTVYYESYEKFLLDSNRFKGKKCVLKPFNEWREDMFIEVIKEKKKTKAWLIPTVSSYITSAARIYMLQFYLKYQKNLIYTDTDSLVTDAPIDSKYVGDGLGYFKKEDEQVKEIFGNKHYRTISGGKELLYLKGVAKDHKIVNDGYVYKKMLRTKEGIRRGIASGLFFDTIKFLSTDYKKRTVKNNITNPLKLSA